MFDIIHMKQKFTEQRGFTLLEVLIAMVIGTIGLLALALMQGNAIEGNASGNKFTQATFVAQDMLETIKDGNIGTFGFVDLTVSPAGTQLDAGGPVNVDGTGIPGGTVTPFARSWVLQSHTEWSRRLIVTVGWNNDLGLNRQVVLTSVSRGDGN